MVSRASGPFTKKEAQETLSLNLNFEVTYPEMKNSKFLSPVNSD